MRKVNEHLNFVVWKCGQCNRREVLWKGADPWSGKRKASQEAEEKELEDTIESLDSEELGCYLAEVMEAVLEGKIFVGVER